MENAQLKVILEKNKLYLTYRYNIEIKEWLKNVLESGCDTIAEQYIELMQYKKYTIPLILRKQDDQTLTMIQYIEEEIIGDIYLSAYNSEWDFIVCEDFQFPTDDLYREYMDIIWSFETISYNIELKRRLDIFYRKEIIPKLFM